MESCEQKRAESLEFVHCDCDMVDLGFKCAGKLVDDPFYKKKGVFERLWLWRKDEEVAVTVDMGNHYCKIVPLRAALSPEKYDEWAGEIPDWATEDLENT